MVGVDTLIGDFVPPEELLNPIQDQHIAERMKLTYQVQRQAADERKELEKATAEADICLLYTSPSPRDRTRSRMPSSP